MPTDNILIVDDDKTTQHLMASYIGSFGFNYDTAEDGAAAVTKLEERDFDIVLTDVIMPRMDGLQLLKYIREHHPDISVIVVTGGGYSLSYTNVIKAGAADFISKPFTVDELEAKLNRLVRELNLVRQLEQYSVCDPLTGLYNRRYFDSKILVEVQRAERQRYNIFLQMIDVDNLKGHNDELGHQNGDKLLKEVSSILQQSSRENVDWAFRYGGDEFCILFTQVELSKIVVIAKRILSKYSQNNFVNTGLSIGIARFIHYAGKTWQEDIADLVTRADRALYYAKNHGKNQVVLDGVS